MDIRKVAVLGAGAVGSYVIWGLSARRDIELGVVADGPRGERLAKEGCAINGKVYRPAVWTPGQAHDADLLIVCLKYGALPGALDSIKAVTGPHTTIMSLMNGVDSEDIIASAVTEYVLLYRRLLRICYAWRRQTGAFRGQLRQSHRLDQQEHRTELPG